MSQILIFISELTVSTLMFLAVSIHPAFSQDGRQLYPEWGGNHHLWRTDQTPGVHHGGEQEGSQTLPYWEDVWLQPMQQGLFWIKSHEETQAIPYWREAVCL